MSYLWFAERWRSVIRSRRLVVLIVVGGCVWWLIGGLFHFSYDVPKGQLHLKATMAGPSEYRYPGQFIYDGVTYSGGVKYEDLLYIRNDLQMSEDDTIVASYPKTGTTWMQEIIWSLTHGPGAIEKREGPLEELFPFLDQNAFGIVGIELVKNLPDPRFIKTHLQSKFFARVLDNVASCPKFVVVIRNPKDALVSYYHFHRSWPAQFKYPGTWDQFFEQYKRQDLAYGDYMDHVLSWWTYKDHPRVMFVQYEDLLTKPHKTIKEIGWFLGAQRNDAEIDTIVQETSFNAMKSRPLSVIFNKPERFGPDLDFYRKGHANTWKEELFNGEQSEYVDGRWNSLCQQHGMPFLYDA